MITKTKPGDIFGGAPEFCASNGIQIFRSGQDLILRTLNEDGRVKHYRRGEGAATAIRDMRAMVGFQALVAVCNLAFCDNEEFTAIREYVEWLDND